MLPCRQGPRYNPAAGHEAISEVAVVVPMAPEQALPNRSRNMQYLLLGAAAALSVQYAVQWLGHTPWWQRMSRKLWWRPDTPPRSPYGSYAGIPSYSHVAILQSLSCTCASTVPFMVSLSEQLAASTILLCFQIYSCCTSSRELPGLTLSPSSLLRFQPETSPLLK